MNGLRVMIALLNDWDAHDYNNSVEATGHERRYVISDAGATFGKGGNNWTRNKSVLRDYADSKFIERANPESVDFVLHSHFVLGPVLNLARLRTHARIESIARGIPRADAKWLGQRLAQLSDKQIRDCFRAAGYTPEEVDGYAKAVEKRIAELNAL